MYKNKHIIIAMLVAPILALIAYFATDYAVSEKPHAAIAGESYKLSASPNCRYESGSCTLKNGELKIEIRAKRRDSGGWLFTLGSNQQLDTAALVIAPEGDTVTAPINMTPLSLAVDTEFKSNWSLSIGDFDKENDLMRVALSLSDSFYYVETQAIFPDFITQFDN